ncbi:glycosyl hydrolase family 8 [Streptosporangium sp. NPDC048047]|uniref:glycosyl hydrolase family 8 n=1 Tax=Streptosporangium sp. NPDC048047 TaxID=3155748 RepID=UPI00343A037A
MRQLLRRPRGLPAAVPAVTAALAAAALAVAGCAADGGTADDAAHGSAAARTPAASGTGGATGTPAPAAPDAPRVPFGGHAGRYAAGTLRPSGDQAVLDAKVVEHYRRWKAAFVRRGCGHGRYQVLSPDADHPYVAEAQGYGMVVTATMAGADPDAKKIFDGLLRYVLAHPSSITPGLLAAEQDASCRSVNGGDSATDGDLDVAYGLLLADRQWGSSGAFDYRGLALDRIRAIRKGEINPVTRLTKLGDWTDRGDEYYWVSRSSDWMIGHFRAFRRATGDPSWDEVIAAHQDLIAAQQTRYAPGTGLLADFVVGTRTDPKPAPREVLEDPHDGAYWWNACRTPWRIGDDAVTSGDARSLAAVRRVSAWIRKETGGDPGRIGAGYTLAGRRLSGDAELAFSAPFAVAAMADPGGQAWLDALWDEMASAAFGRRDYFSASVTLQAMITVSGNRWTP